jgi:hypothetical protein
MVAIILGWFIFSMIYTYVAVNSYLDSTTAKVGKAIQIQSIAWDGSTGKIIVYVQNVGDSDVTLSSVYVNGELDNTAIINPKDLSTADTSEITLSGTYTSKPLQITVKVVTVDGTFAEYTKTFP